MISYKQCPCCGSNYIRKSLVAKDYTVSQQDFEIWICDDCTLQFTQHIPDANEIGAYYKSTSYISHTDTKKGLVNRLYHLVRNYTLKTKRKLIQEASGIVTGTLLDVGAGTGAFSHAMQSAGWKVTGLEPDPDAREVALQKYGLQLKPAEKLYELDHDQFDCITMWHVLEHVHDLHGYLEKFHSILKPRGRLLIAVPNYTSLDADIHGEYWAAYDVPRHLYHFSPKSIQLLAKAKGFEVRDHKPMWFDSFYVSMLSEKYRTGSNGLLRAVKVGLLSNFKTTKDHKKCSSVIYVLAKS